MVRRIILAKLLELPGVTVAAIDERNEIVGYGSRRLTCGINWHEIGPLYAESYGVAQDLMASLCRDIGKGESVVMTVW